MNEIEFSKSDIAKKLANFKLPRYEELTPYPIVMRQLIAILDDCLSIFNVPGEEKALTSSMINSYVRKKVIAAPVNKDYNKNHIIHLISIGILKQILPISNVGELIKKQIKQYPIDISYNYLCDELEKALKVTFGSRSFAEYKSTPKVLTPLTEEVHSAMISFANKIYVKQSLFYEKNYRK